MFGRHSRTLEHMNSWGFGQHTQDMHKLKAENSDMKGKVGMRPHSELKEILITESCYERQISLRV